MGAFEKKSKGLSKSGISRVLEKNLFCKWGEFFTVSTAKVNRFCKGNSLRSQFVRQNFFWW